LLAVIPIVVLALVVGGAFFKRTQRGWRGAYYPTQNLTGNPTVRRDPSLMFRWYDDAPMPGFPDSKFSVRWETCLTVGDEADLEAYVGSDDGIRMRIDGETVSDHYYDRAFRADHVPLDLTPGRHHVVVEYYDSRSQAHALVRFQEAGIISKPLPLDRYRLPKENPGEADPCDSGFW